MYHVRPKQTVIRASMVSMETSVKAGVPIAVYLVRMLHTVTFVTMNTLERTAELNVP